MFDTGSVSNDGFAQVAEAAKKRQKQTMATLPFNPPNLLTARRTMGFVDVPDSAGSSVKEEWNGKKRTSTGQRKSDISPPPTLAGPNFLQRMQTMSGNIVVFEEDGKTPQAFWLSRKIGKSCNGIIRLGYRLRPNTKPDFKDSRDAWELDVQESGEGMLVTVNMMNSSLLGMKSEGTDNHNPLDEFSALQMIANQNSLEDAHVVGSEIVGTCSSHVYAILPYSPDGTLLQFCLVNGRLEEPVARFLFGQILRVGFLVVEPDIKHRRLTCR